MFAIGEGASVISGLIRSRGEAEALVSSLRDGVAAVAVSAEAAEIDAEAARLSRYIGPEGIVRRNAPASKR